MYVQVGDFCNSRGPPTVPLTQILRNEFFLTPKIRIMWGSSVGFNRVRNSIQITHCSATATKHSALAVGQLTLKKSTSIRTIVIQSQVDQDPVQ